MARPGARCSSSSSPSLATKATKDQPMSDHDPVHDPVRIGLVSVSDRASSGAYEDKGLPALRQWLERALRNPMQFETRLIPDEQAQISDALRELVDHARCDL